MRKNLLRSPGHLPPTRYPDLVRLEPDSSPLLPREIPVFSVKPLCLSASAIHSVRGLLEPLVSA